MSTTTPPTQPSGPLLDSVFGDLWPDVAKARPRLVAAAVVVGVVWAVVLPHRDLGLGTALCLAAVLGTVAAPRLSTATRGELVALGLCALLLAPVVLRDAVWVAVLCVLAAFGVGSMTLTRAGTVPALLASAFTVPMSGIRGLPWLGRSLRVPGRGAAWLPVLRTVVLSVVLVGVFTALFASADAVFARWVGLLVPDVTVDGLALRAFVAALAFGLTAAGVYAAVSPPALSRLALPAARPVRRLEWVVPLALVVATFATFLAAQATALFGGHGYLRRTTGLTYADYVHEGFGQLTAVTVLTLGVVAVAVRRAPRATATDRRWLRGLLGLLCLMSLVVVGSALHRMHVYEEAYGFTRLRVLVSVFEAWLGVVLVLVLAAGVALRGPWVPRVAVLTGAVMLLGLALANPDAYVAERNVERFLETGKVDWDYLSGLSADAVPALTRLPEGLVGCAVDPQAAAADDWLEWNLGRARAATLLPTAPVPATGCH